jgi:hypothetical protein
MTKNILLILALTTVLAACGTTPTTNTPANSNAKPANATNAGTAKSSPSIDPNMQATFPYKDFPAVETTAKPGEVILVPSYNWLQEANVKGPDKVTMIWYNQKMSAPDKEMSEVEFMMGEKHKVPNAYIIPIPAGQKAKKGDIVLTWWQSGSGMQRAIVVDDANPAEPVVRYLDLDYDNPAKSRDGKTTIGQMDEQLKPNTFVKINAPMEPGTAVAIQDGDRMKHAIVIRVTGDKVFVNGFAGTTSVVDKSRCTPLPIVSTAKEGEKVRALSISSLEEGTVTKVDPKIGRVFIKFNNDSKERAIAFGNLMK